MQFFGFKRFEYLVSIGGMLMLTYFFMQAFYGPRGLPYHKQLLQHTTSLQKDLGMISDQRKAIETRVALMRPESIDPDMLDELARKNLNLVKKTDIVVKF
jgi:cell division protein FtsB